MLGWGNISNASLTPPHIPNLLHGAMSLRILTIFSHVLLESSRATGRYILIKNNLKLLFQPSNTFSRSQATEKLTEVSTPSVLLLCSVFSSQCPVTLLHISLSLQALPPPPPLSETPSLQLPAFFPIYNHPLADLIQSPSSVT